jgi:hypothetical protein
VSGWGSYVAFEDSEPLREACNNRCAGVGDPPCWALNPSEGINGGVDVRYEPCGECLRDIGVEPGDEFDEAAAVRRLL